MLFKVVFLIKYPSIVVNYTCYFTAKSRYRALWEVKKALFRNSSYISGTLFRCHKRFDWKISKLERRRA